MQNVKKRYLFNENTYNIIKNKFKDILNKVFLTKKK